MAENDFVLAKLEPARQLLAKASNASEAKQVADVAKAAEVYARRQKLSQESINFAKAIHIDSLALMGEFLKRADKQNGARGLPGPGRGKRSTQSEPRFRSQPTIASTGISKRESSNAQAVADLKEKAPELYDAVRNGKTTITRARVEKKRDEKRRELDAKAAAAPKLTDWQIICGDCTVALQAIKQQFRLIFADPPYNIGIDYGNGTSADRLPPDEYIHWLTKWIDLCRNLLAKDGSLWLLINDEYAAEFCIAAKRCGLHLRNWIKWYETFGVNCSNQFNRTSRHLFYFLRDPKKFVFNHDAVTRPSARQVLYNDARAVDGGKLWDDVWAIPRLTGTSNERMPDFPTQLPLALLRPIIECATEPGDWVLDPFNGSGTTGYAAIELKRRYIGIEKEKRWHDLSTKRLKAVQ